MMKKIFILLSFMFLFSCTTNKIKCPVIVERIELFNEYAVFQGQSVKFKYKIIISSYFSYFGFIDETHIYTNKKYSIGDTLISY